MSEQASRPMYLWSVLNNRCPRCREGKIFKEKSGYTSFTGTVAMHEACPVCGQPTDIEVGFYYGTSFVSHAISVLIMAISFAAWWFIFGFSLYNNSIFYWLGFNAVFLVVLQPYLMRVSRTLWLSWFVKYDVNWKQKKVHEYERVVKGQMNNW